jgi:hypothetical protein
MATCGSRFHREASFPLSTPHQLSLWPAAGDSIDPQLSAPGQHHPTSASPARHRPASASGRGISQDGTDPVLEAWRQEASRLDSKLGILTAHRRREHLPTDVRESGPLSPVRPSCPAAATGMRQSTAYHPPGLTDSLVPGSNAVPLRWSGRVTSPR